VYYLNAASSVGGVSSLAVMVAVILSWWILC
jgi:hypothetical protein